jgi:PAS domain S-box-containing protein
VTVPLRVLILEDSPEDAELLEVQLGRSGFTADCTVADNPADYLSGLGMQPDIVIADYTLPQMTVLDALRLMQETGHDIPLIVVSGVMDEETCVRVLRHGAVDYLLKDRLTRLGPAVAHALEQQQLRLAQRRAERAAADNSALLREFVSDAPMAAYLTDSEGRFLLANSKFERQFGVSATDLVGGDARSMREHEIGDSLITRDLQTLQRRAVIDAEESFGAGEKERYYLSTRYPLYRADGTPYAVAAIYTDITTQKRTENELRIARELMEQSTVELARKNEELTTLDRLKSQFIATVSHELRTPLTSIRGYTELLSDMQLGPGELRIVEIIDANGRRLLSLIEDLLTFARMEQGEIPLELGKVDVAALVDRCLAVMMPVAAGNGVVLTADSVPDLPVIEADASQLERVLLNLLSNAVKFSPQGGDVTVRIRCADGQVTVAVTDTGIGVPAHEQDKLFTRFFRAQDAERQAIPGTGLGLAICKTIVEAHDGWIEAQSTFGVGTTIRFGVPLRS